MKSIKSKLLIGFLGLAATLLALPLHTVGVFADQSNGYYITTSASASPASLYLKGTGTPDISKITVNATGKGVAAHTPVDVVMVVDASGSMYGQPMTDEITAAKAFINSMDSATDQVSVIPFADDVPQSPEAIQQLSSDFTTVKSYVDAIPSLTSTGGATNYEVALNAANAELTSARRHNGTIPVLVFMSDGGANTGNYDPAYLAGLCTAMKNSNVQIYTIGLGVVGSDGDLLKSMASSTVGTNDHYYETPDSNQLVTLYNSVAASLPSLAATKVSLDLKLSSQVELVANSWSIAPASVTNGVYTFNLPDSLNGKTTPLTFQVKALSGTPGQTIQVLDTTKSILNYTDYLSVVSTAAVVNQNLILSSPIKAPNTAVGRFILANPLAVAGFGVLSAGAIIFATRRQLSKK